MFPLTPDQTQKTLQQLSALFSTFTKQCARLAWDILWLRVEFVPR